MKIVVVVVVVEINAIYARMNLHETIIYMSTHKQIHRHMYKYISTNILTRLPILT